MCIPRVPPYIGAYVRVRGLLREVGADRLYTSRTSGGETACIRTKLSERAREKRGRICWRRGKHTGALSSARRRDFREEKGGSLRSDCSRILYVLLFVQLRPSQIYIIAFHRRGIEY